MIPALQPYDAVFKNPGEGKPSTNKLPVIAWDDEGNALIALAEGGTLAAANRNPNFICVQPARRNAVGVIPGGGYRVVFKQEEGHYVADVLGWVVDEDRYTEPLWADEEGTVYSLDDYGFERLLVPGESFPGEPTANDDQD